MSLKPAVLVVEDNFAMRELLKAVLDRSGCLAEFATDGNQAWELLTSGKHKFSILLTDYDLPGMSGVALIKKVISENYHLDLIILVTSFDKTNPDIQEARKTFPTFVEFQFIEKHKHGFVPALFNELKRVVKVKAEQ